MGSDLSIGRRLALAFAAVVLVFLAVAGVAWWSNAKLEAAEKLNVHTYKVLSTGEGMLQALTNMETGARGFLLAGRDQYLEPWTKGLSDFDTYWSEAKALTSDNPAQQARLEQMKAREVEFKGLIEGLLSLRRQVQGGTATHEEVVQAFAQGKDKSTMDAFRALQVEFENTERALLVQRAAEAESTRALSRWSIVLGTLLAVAAAAVLGLAITRSITRPIQQAVAAAQTVAEGDLRLSLSIQRQDETGQLLQALQGMSQSLARVVTAVRASSDSIATGSSQIASGNADLSQRTEEQASNLQQTAASMEQLSGTVAATADTARQANQLAIQARDAAANGGAVMSRVVQTMQDISASSHKISDIISVIDGIAFQTNILALNAAVEAARAGEQGRGFAVVASEVRQLAQRSAQAAREIKSLISASVERVEAGSHLVGDAGASMEEIVRQVKRVADMIGDISAAAVEQTSGITQVNAAVTQLDQVTQQNAALVEESAAAAESLRHQAGRLVDAVQVFKL